MKIKSSIVIAAAAGSTVAPNAEAIAQPRNTQNVVASPAWTWTGFYVGGHLGAAWQKGENNGAYFDGGTQFPFYNATSHTGFMGGGQIGYNWQSGIVVYGLEADISTLTGNGGSATQSFLHPGGVAVSQTSSNNIEWFGTVRARLGFTFGTNTLVYATGGWAYGHVKNTHTQREDAAFSATWSESKIRGGYVAGGGVEYMFAPNWTVRAEGLYVNLGENTLAKPNTGTCDEGCMPVTFTNKVGIARAGINYRF